MARFLHLTGLTDYTDAHELQRSLVDAVAAGTEPDTVLLLEHAEVITLGRKRGAEDHVLDAGDVPVVHVERGGDVTWHGPGQLVAYPIIKLEGKRADLHLHLRSLEQAVIDLLAEQGLTAGRDARNTGVWLPGGDPEARKVCSIGIAARRWVSWHGLALNVDVDLSHFDRIAPCGFDASIMTTVAQHSQPAPTVAELVPGLARCLARTLDVSLDTLQSVTSSALHS